MTVNWKLHKIDNIYRMTNIFIHRIHVVLQFFCTWNLLMPLSNENTGHLCSLKRVFSRSWCATLIPQDVPKRLRASSLSFKQFCDQASFSVARWDWKRIILKNRGTYHFLWYIRFVLHIIFSNDIWLDFHYFAQQMLNWFRWIVCCIPNIP